MRKTLADLYNEYSQRYNEKPKHSFSHFIRVISMIDHHRTYIRPKIVSISEDTKNLTTKNKNTKTKQCTIPVVNDSLFVGCEVKLKSNEYSTGLIIGKSKRGKDFWKVEWDDGSGITNTFGGHLDCY